MAASANTSVIGRPVENGQAIAFELPTPEGSVVRPYTRKKSAPWPAEEGGWIFRRGANAYYAQRVSPTRDICKPPCKNLVKTETRLTAAGTTMAGGARRIVVTCHDCGRSVAESFVPDEPMRIDMSKALAPCCPTCTNTVTVEDANHSATRFRTTCRDCGRSTKGEWRPRMQPRAVAASVSARPTCTHPRAVSKIAHGISYKACVECEAILAGDSSSNKWVETLPTDELTRRVLARNRFDGCELQHVAGMRGVLVTGPGCHVYKDVPPFGVTEELVHRALAEHGVIAPHEVTENWGRICGDLRGLVRLYL